jgi:hypothetical protein
VNDRHDQAGAVAIDAAGVRHHDITDDLGLGEARRRFGGIDVPATLAGMLAALGLTVVLAGIAGAAGSIGYQRGVDDTNLSVGGLAAGLAVLVVAFFVGGWVAARIARYDGVRNSILTAVWFVVLAAAVSALGVWAGDRYDFFDDVRLPQWFSNADTTAAVVTALAGVAVMIAAAAVGGAVGARYHRRADAVIANTRTGGIVRGSDARARLDQSTRQTAQR